MVHIFRFAGVRPRESEAPRIAAVPYDVVTTEEAAACIHDNGLSFLRISRPDALLPDLPPTDDEVYRTGSRNFQEFLAKGLMVRDGEPSMYIYRVSAPGQTYIGLCCGLDVQDYEKEVIRRHELTRYDKEEDRTRHIDAVNAHTGPVVLLYRDANGGQACLEALIADMVPVAEVAWEGDTLHQVFHISDPAALSRLEALFDPVERLYIADGHHRAKSAVNVSKKRKEEGRWCGECDHFMGVLFAHDGVKIHGYSRLVTDLGGYAPWAFMARVRDRFEVRPCGKVDACGFHIPPIPEHARGYHVIHMYLAGEWYECSRPVSPGEGPIENLDVSVLQREVLTPLLFITDPRGDPRLQYLGGARPLADLEEMVDQGEYEVAFAMQPVKVETVLEIADKGGIMPPKSTWFEPKLLSGLVVHTLD
ncbi:uncharacterized protein (DUF1015 family) [Methanolinea mesophila]|uniref:DUF1015 domain-containing protein n=1 Tax=Methanolinea mesophila TaxID=547055 RepID=UPI001AE52A20|nr:DUF1015 family protein [Methanolinea mesophila]MBP1928701.1 uncharacterized protein (DUF1015 family) [Methanolinea mesophila]